jgi:hypothetical protein
MKQFYQNRKGKERKIVNKDRKGTEKRKLGI